MKDAIKRKRFIKSILTGRQTLHPIALPKMIKFFVRNRICKQQIDEAHFMCECSAKVKRGGTIVEIGRKYGGSMMLMCKANHQIQIHSIDIQDKHILFTQMMSEQLGIKSKMFEMIVSDSKKYKWSGPEIDLLFIDGDHAYDYVYSDLTNFAPHVAKGGMVLMNDYHKTRHGVKRAVTDFLKSHKEFRRDKIIRTNCLLTK